MGTRNRTLAIVCKQRRSRTGQILGEAWAHWANRSLSHNWKCAPCNLCVTDRHYAAKSWQKHELKFIGVGDGGGVGPPNSDKNYFLGKNRVKFGHFVNFSCIYFRAKMSSPQSWLSSYAYAKVTKSRFCFMLKAVTAAEADETTPSSF